MANISDAWGDYQFDFTNTALQTAGERKAWLEKLANMLKFDDGWQPDYYTDLYLSELADDEFTPVTHVEFGGSGRWNYQNNLQWFHDGVYPSLTEHLLAVDGLIMTINYNDLEEFDYIQATDIIKVADGKVIYIADENPHHEIIYPKRYLELGIGDAVDAVNHFTNGDELSDDEFWQVLEMDKEQFLQWMND